MDPSQLEPPIAALQRRGFVQQDADGHLSLTPSGRSNLDQLVACREQHLRGLLEGWDTEHDQVILTRPCVRGKLDAVLATDPLVVQHLAHYTVIEFSATRTAHEFHAINEALAS